PWCQPAKHVPHQAQHELRTNVTVRQSPDFRLFPLLPEVLDRLPGREQIMDTFNQQYIFLRDDWRGQKSNLTGSYPLLLVPALEPGALPEPAARRPVGTTLSARRATEERQQT